MIKIELTDTFGGEANYSWVKRFEIKDESLTDLQLVRKAKKLAGLNGVRCNKSEYGDLIELKPYGINMVLFITWEY